MARRRRRGGAQAKEVAIALPTRHPGQNRIIKARRRFNVLACGRRWGKTDLFTDIALDGTHEGDAAAVLNGGRIGWWVGRQAHFSEVWDHVSTILRPIARKIDSNLHEIRLHNGGGIDFWTLHQDWNTGRGRKYHRSIIDEAAFARYLEKAWQRTIMPTLADYQGDAWFGSSPDGFNYFRMLHLMGDPHSEFYRPGWASFQAPSAENPFIDPAEIELQRLQMSDASFRQEWLAQFVEGSGGMFQRDWLRWYHRPVPADQMVRVLLVDPASGKKKDDGEDYSAFWVLGLHDDHRYYVLDFVRERYDLVERAKMLFALHRTYRPHFVGYEEYGMQSDVAHIKDKMERDQYRFDIETLGGKMPKEKRIERLVAPFKTGQIYMPSADVQGHLIGMAHRALKVWIETEFILYPNVPHDDGLDGLARIFDMGAEWPNSVGRDRDEVPEYIPRPSIGSVLHGSY